MSHKWCWLKWSSSQIKSHGVGETSKGVHAATQIGKPAHAETHIAYAMGPASAIFILDVAITANRRTSKTSIELSVLIATIFELYWTNILLNYLLLSDWLNFELNIWNETIEKHHIYTVDLIVSLRNIFLYILIILYIISLINRIYKYKWTFYWCVILVLLFNYAITYNQPIFPWNR